MRRAKGTILYLYSLDYQLLSTFPSARAAAKSLNSSDVTVMKYTSFGCCFQRSV